MPAHRVVLVREWDAQMSGSGCCGRLGGVMTDLCDPETYAHTRRDMEAMGEVYRAVRDAFPDEDVEITVADPRNMIWLVPSIWREARRRGMTPAEAWRQANRATANGAVVVDGLVLFSGGIPSPEEALAAVRAELAPA
jgi:hypothetical protein